MLGEDFPKDEIQSILHEASKDGKVTYADFLALWESRKEKQRDEVLKDIDMELSPVMSGDISVLSDISDTLMLDDEKETLMARASFIDGKKMSERKVIVSHVPSEMKDGRKDTDKKSRVMFSSDEPVIIQPTWPQIDHSVLSGDV